MIFIKILIFIEIIFNIFICACHKVSQGGNKPGTTIPNGDPFTGFAGNFAPSGVGNIYQNLLTAGAQNREYARGEGEKAGKGIGGFLFDILSGGGNFGFGKKPAPFGQGYGVLR